VATCLTFAGLFSLLLGGFAILALSQDQHRRALGAAPQGERVRTVQRIAGHILLMLALPLALWRDGPGFGALLWACLLMAAAFAVTVTLSWRPRWLAPLAGRRRP
jgi:hypothetical protein